jgi:HEAT repeat protein
MLHAPLPAVSWRHRFGQAGLLALLLGVACLQAAEPDERLPPDPVEELRLIIRQEYKGSTDKATRELATRYRKKILDKAEQQIQTLGDLSRALLLIEWRTGGSLVGGEDIDRQVRETLTDRFIAEVRKVFARGSTDQQVAAAGVVAATLNGMANPALDLALAGKVSGLSEDLARLTRTGSVPTRAAAARALGQFALSPDVATRALDPLIHPDQPVSVRQGAADALLALSQLISTTEPSRRSEPGISISDRQRPQWQLKTDRRREIAREVVPLALRALQDPDRNVRLQAALALQELATSVVDQLKGAPLRLRETLPPRDRDWSEEEYAEVERIRGELTRFRDDHRPIVQAFNQHTAGLVATVNDPDPEVRQVILHVIQELGRARRLFVTVEAAIPPRPRRREIRAPRPALPPAGGLRLVAGQELLAEDSRPVDLPSPGKLLPRQKDAPEDKQDKGKKGEGDKKDKASETLEPLFARLVEGLAADLKSPDLLTRRGAIIALESLEEAAETRVEAIVAATCDIDAIVRWVAARALGRFEKQAPRVVPALVKLLRDIDLDARSAAANALGNLGPSARDAVPHLAAAVNRGDIEFRLVAMKALENIGTPAVPALPALALALRDPSPRIRSEAARVLGRFGPLARDHAAALERLAGDPDFEVRRVANEALLAVTRK